MKLIGTVFLGITIFLTGAFPVNAIYSPLSVPNNKFGIHVADTNDIADTAALINSSGGDWGYVTMVMQDNDQNSEKWQRIFNAMRRLHLIPIVRLATHPEGDSWLKPSAESADDWAHFLNSLNWPTSNRYVVLFNEPNHAKEWGNTLDPEGYASILMAFSRVLKATSDDFFVLPAGLDASASSDGEALDEMIFLRRMIASQPDIPNAIDGWTSHSYPNPGFSGSPLGWGRGSLRSYVWELSLLADLGNTKELPVFITETGWIHSNGKIVNYGLLSPEAVAQNFVFASSVWQDARIIAVTPFVFNYQDIPFDHFSWRKLGNDGFYPQYDSYKEIAKTAGRPKQHLVYNLTHPLFPPVLVAGSSYNLVTEVKNEGSGILDEHDDYQLVVQAENSELAVTTHALPTLEPGDTGEISVSVQTPKTPGDYMVSVYLSHYGRQVLLEKHVVRIVPAPSLALHLDLGWRRENNANDLRVLVYDGPRLMHEFKGLTVSDGRLNVAEVTDIIPGNSYRIVVFVPYYLPRQSVQVLTSQTTDISFKRFLPFDVDNDGAFTAKDIFALLTLPPKVLITRFVGP